MKKKYTKPSVKKNAPLVNVTFSSVGGSAPGSGGSVAPAIG